MSVKMESSENDSQTQLRKAILAISNDASLTDEEKSRKRQQLLMGGWSKKVETHTNDTKDAPAANNAADASTECPTTKLDENLKCGICLELCERPVTAPCQHNFCLACFNKWHYQGKKTCPSCRAPFPSRFAQNPRINTALIVAIRLAKNPVKAAAPAKEYKRIDNESRPEQAFVTERAVRAGRANAASGRIMVTIPNDYFGPILPEHDPSRNLGVQVGDWWKDRLDCRQWGAHFPHVAGIAGQSNTGAQSVVLSGGYEDDKDEGEWFLYTGSGGRDLSGNKRTNKVQSFDQEFESMNKALMLSCTRGLPVRVVRSHKEKRSAYAPPEEFPVRYDGIYRILRSWRKPGNQGPLVCRYLFMRCDNSPAPWSSAETGDEVRMEIPPEAEEEMTQAKGKIHEICPDPYWDWLPNEGKWGWAKPPPALRPAGNPRSANPAAKLRKKLSEHEKALKEFKCLACKNVLVDPIRTPCGHNFCKPCLDKKFAGVSDTLARNESVRSLRVKKVVKPCPSCKADIAEFLTNAQVNREMRGVIEKLQEAVARAREEADKLEKEGAAAGGEEEEAEEVEEAEEQGAECEEGDAEDGAGTLVKQAAKKAKTEKPTNGAAAQVDKVASPTKPAPEQQVGKAGVKEEEEEATGSSEAEGTNSEAPVSQGTGDGGCQGGDKEAPYKYAAALARIMSEFPEADEELVKSLLADQGGDEAGVADVRFTLKKLNRKPAAPRRPVAAGKATAKGRGGRGKKAAAAAAEDAQAEEGAEIQGDAGGDGQDVDMEGGKAEEDAAQVADAEAAGEGGGDGEEQEEQEAAGKGGKRKAGKGDGAGGAKRARR